MFKNKKKENDVPELDALQATRTLEGVFRQAQVEPNDIPMEALSTYGQVNRKEPFVIQRMVLILVMLFFLLLPVLFIAPKYTVEAIGEDPSGLPRYKVEIHTMLPVKQVLATMDDQSVRTDKVDGHTYKIMPENNGVMELTVTLFNFQRTRQRIEVTEVDEDKPVLRKSYTDNNRIYLYVKDRDSGVDHKAVYAVNERGKRVSPESVNNAKGEIVFLYPRKSLDVYIPDNLGNYLHLFIEIS